jgi:hypothetical protein
VVCGAPAPPHGLFGVGLVVLFAQFPALLDVFLFPGLQLLALFGVPRWELDGFLRLDAGLKLAAAFHFCVELGAEQ